MGGSLYLASMLELLASPPLSNPQKVALPLSKTRIPLLRLGAQGVTYTFAIVTHWAVCDASPPWTLGDVKPMFLRIL